MNEHTRTKERSPSEVSFTCRQLRDADARAYRSARNVAADAALAADGENADTHAAAADADVDARVASAAAAAEKRAHATTERTTEVR